MLKPFLHGGGEVKIGRRPESSGLTMAEDRGTVQEGKKGGREMKEKERRRRSGLFEHQTPN